MGNDEKREWKQKVMKAFVENFDYEPEVRDYDYLRRALKHIGNGLEKSI